MDISKLAPGDNHYMAFVGPPTQYDFMGATQFRLLCALGLRSHHSLLDFGCGSLRAGRFLISYLNQGKYFGIDPNEWLIRDGIENEIGNDLVRIKKPQFDYNAKFATDVFGMQFDFIIAQSMFSHAGRDIVNIALKNFKESLTPSGLIAATFVEGSVEFDGTGWVYPGCVDYLPSTVEIFAEQAGLAVIRIPWYHPRQTWYLFAKEKQYLPEKEMLPYLSGAVLYDPEFIASWHKYRPQHKNDSLMIFLKRFLPKPIKSMVKKLIGK